MSKSNPDRMSQRAMLACFQSEVIRLRSLNVPPAGVNVPGPSLTTPSGAGQSVGHPLDPAACSKSVSQSNHDFTGRHVKPGDVVSWHGWRGRVLSVRRGVAYVEADTPLYVNVGAYWKEMSDEEKSIKQADVDKIYSQFKEAMESFRMVSDENCGNGVVFDGEQAAEIGFTDGVVEDMDEILDGMV